MTNVCEVAGNRKGERKRNNTKKERRVREAESKRD